MNHGLVLLLLCCLCLPSRAGQYTFRIEGTDLLLNDQPFKIIGLRCSNALISDDTTQQLIDNLDTYRAHGINMVSVFLMGSRFGDVQGYRADASLEPRYADRLARIIEAADQRGMVVLVGCLYWSVSTASEALGHWTQVEANRAVAQTVDWLVKHEYRNVLVDPDNEGMAGRARNWSTEALIAAAHAVDRSIIVANNTRQPAPNADLNIHFGPKEPGKPWLDSEATPGKTPGGYWGRYSKQAYQADNAYYNYSRIGRYTSEMKEEQRRTMREEMAAYNGYVLASTWLQCSPAMGIGGPFTSLGGQSELGSGDDPDAAWNTDIDTLHPDAGVRWWFVFVKDTYGPWVPPTVDARSFLEQDGHLSIEAEQFSRHRESTYSQYASPHRWVRHTDRDGYSGSGFVQVLPDEWPEGGSGPSSPRDASGARLDYPIRIENPGTYYVYVRGMSMGGESNGIHVGVDGALAGREAGASNLSGFRPHGEWVWEHGRKEGYAEPALLTLSRGKHWLQVWNRDDGFRFDKILLRRQPNPPDGIGPPESPRSVTR